MRKPCNLVWAVALAAAAGCGRPGPADAPTSWPSVELHAGDRLLVLAPHPDDEVLCCGGLIQQALRLGVPVRVAFLTYGDNNQWSFAIYRHHPVLLPWAVRGMGEVRHDEAVAAARRLGLGPDALTFLGYPDFSTLRIWEAHWGAAPPLGSMLTRVSAVPYPNARRPGAPYKGEEIVRDLTEILGEFHPTRIAVSHPADHMPDHLALYLFTRIALLEHPLEPAPELLPYLVHHPRWPRPRGDHPGTVLQPPAALRQAAVWRSHPLSREERDRKRQAVREHRTQYAYSARYLLSFMRANELFGDFPTVTLRPNGFVSLAPELPGAPKEVPEELTEQERAAFVGVETRTAQLDGRDLVLTVTFSRPLGEAVGVSVYAFGWRPDRSFAGMPKIHVQFAGVTHQAFDQRQPLPAGAVTMQRSPRAITIRIPLAALGDPAKLFTSARTYLGEVPLDWVSWRVLELQPAA